MKVYLFIYESCYEDEPQHPFVRVYGTLKQAQEDMDKAVAEELAEGTLFGDMWNNPATRDNVVIEKRASRYTIYEDGRYNSNHAVYYIVEREVE